MLFALKVAILCQTVQVHFDLVSSYIDNLNWLTRLLQSHKGWLFEWIIIHGSDIIHRRLQRDFELAALCLETHLSDVNKITSPRTVNSEILISINDSLRNLQCPTLFYRVHDFDGFIPKLLGQLSQNQVLLSLLNLRFDPIIFLSLPEPWHITVRVVVVFVNRHYSIFVIE